MKKLGKGNIVLILLSAILIYLSLPPFKLPTLSIIGFGLYLFLIRDFTNFRRGLKISFLVGFILGYLFFYWLYYPLSMFYSTNIILSFLAVIPVAMFFSVYHFVILYLALFGIYKVTKDKFKTLLMAPFIWTFLEVLREFTIFGGFPWNFIGYTISYIPIVLQVTSLFGIYILTLFILLLALLLSWIFIYFKEGFKLSKIHIYTSLSVFFLFVFIVWFGYWKLENYKEEGVKKKVALVQGNISQRKKLSAKSHADINREYIELINSIKPNEADLIILPESSIYILPYYEDDDYKKFFKSIKNKDATILAGVDDIIISKDGDVKVYNSVYLFKGTGEKIDKYRKIKLVPFGEYTPKPFGLFKGLVKYLGGINFSPGDKKQILVYDGFKIIPLICFESIFPYFVAEFSKNGNLIVNITNDAWFGDTTAPYQHFEMSRVRAVENGKYLVRVANTGISAVVNPLGEIKGILPTNTKKIGIANVLLIDKETFFEKYLIPIYAFYIFFPFILFLILIKREIIQALETGEGEKEVKKTSKDVKKMVMEYKNKKSKDNTQSKGTDKKENSKDREDTDNKKDNK